MKRIIDECILLIYCLAAILFVPEGAAFVASFLAALIYGSLCLLRIPSVWHVIVTVVYAGLGVVCAELFLFLPLIIYGVLEYRNYLLALFCMAAGLGTCLEAGPEVFVFLLLGCVLGAVFQYQTGRCEQLSQEFKRYRDDSAERNIELREKNQHLMDKQDYEIYAATLRERNRIAREIHDSVGHMLSRAILMVGAMKAAGPAVPTGETLCHLEDTLNEAMTSIRKSVHDLRDESINLKETMEALAKEFTFCPVELVYDVGYQVPRAVKYSFIMIVKEALSNIIRHSKATKVQITLREHPGLYQLIVEDNGGAQDPKGAQESWENIDRGNEDDGMGLANIRERIQVLKGTFQMRRNGGFSIYVTVPKS